MLKVTSILYWRREKAPCWNLPSSSTRVDFIAGSSKREKQKHICKCKCHRKTKGNFELLPQKVHKGNQRGRWQKLTLSKALYKCDSISICRFPPPDSHSPSHNIVNWRQIKSQITETESERPKSKRNSWLSISCVNNYCTYLRGNKQNHQRTTTKINLINSNAQKVVEEHELIGWNL